MTVQPVPKQARSRKTYDTVLRAARKLFSRRDYETVSIADIAAAAGYSVGTIYARFPSKEALFQVLLQEMVRESEAAIGTALAGLPPRPRPREIIHCVVRALVAVISRDEGILRTTLRRSQADPSAWTPLRQSGAALTARATELLARSLGKATKSHRIAFAFQMMLGTLVNMVLNNPGPMTLRDAALADELSDAMHAYLTAPETGAGKKSSKS